MKRNALRIPALLLLLCLCFTVSCGDRPATGNDNQDSAISYSPVEDGYVLDHVAYVVGELVIPSTYEGRPIVGISEVALSDFRECRKITSVTIPDSVISIGEGAFFGCTKLASITVDAGNPRYYVKNNCLIDAERKMLIVGGQGGTIPDDGSVVAIGIGAFYDRTELTDITIPAGVTDIGINAFSHCRKLASITVAAGNPIYRSDGNCLIETASQTLILGCRNSVIPSGVAGIGKSAFEDCIGLTSITIPGSVTTIGDQAFMRCDGLASVTIGDGVKGIGEFAFAGCTGLTGITIPDSVTSIGQSAFHDCGGLTSITYKGTMAEWENIVKEYGWNENTGAYVIHCTDGDISK